MGNAYSNILENLFDIVTDLSLIINIFLDNFLEDMNYFICFNNLVKNNFMLSHIITHWRIRGGGGGAKGELPAPLRIIILVVDISYP